MARLVLVATGVLLLSLLAVASCRVLEAEPETVVAISDEQQGQADPAVLQETDAAEAIQSVPTVTAAEAILRLPSHRRAWFLHRHLRSARHHGLSHRRSAFACPGEARVVPASLLEEPTEVKLEAVAEPDPDSRPEIDGEQKLFHGEEEEVEENESVKAWKREMLRRFRDHGLRFHHCHHHHEHDGEKDGGDHQEQQNKEKGPGDMQLQHVRMFSGLFDLHHGDVEQEEQDNEEGVPVELVSRHFHHHHGDEEPEETARKHFFHHHHESDNEVDEVEELAWKLSKAIMRRSFRRGGMRHHLHHHHRAEDGGVKNWFKGLMNRF
ncbi:uncharacterized protein [Lolium perenne]|uniref:uncharacterized protein n=1 Tax=Lolium perenne TaxID=4522 RepID=UPI0021EB2F6B|nr:uncharacterized protein LOC127344969 [Lolium perenne]